MYLVHTYFAASADVPVRFAVLLLTYRVVTEVVFSTYA
jgi:hypothetical protein